MNISDYKLIAHRGLHGEKIPENSTDAFIKAVNKGYAIELDVHITLDKQIVVYHDHDLLRLTGVQKEIEDLTLEEIQKLRLNNTNYTIPTLREVLDIVDGKVAILIEIKNKTVCYGPEKELLDIMNNYKGEYAVESFNPISIKYFKDNAPNIPRGLITQNNFENIKSFVKNFFLKNVKAPEISLNADFVSYNISDLTNETVNKYKKKNIYLLGWTITNMQDFEKAKLFCDGIVFEKIEP